MMPRKGFLLASVFALLCGLTPSGHTEPLFGLIDGTTLVTFDSLTPGTITSTRAISGLNTGEVIQAIDLRPQDGLLYGFSTQNRLFNFTLGVTAAANLVFAPASGTNNAAATAPLSAFPPSGQVSTDFNPQANALRLEDTTDNNYRVPFATFPPTTLFNDGVLRITTAGDFGQAVGVAYTNNFPGTSSTQLFVIDAVTNGLFLQTTPNNGTLSPIGSGFGLDIPTASVGFDISGTTTAYLSANAQGGLATELYTINLAAGTITLVGNIGGAAGAAVQDIAATAVTAIPEPSTLLLLAPSVAGLLALGWRRRHRSA